MFQKSCLFKCIQASNKFNESIDVLKLNSHLDATPETNHGQNVNKKTQQWSATLKKRLNLKKQSNKKQLIIKQNSYDTYNDDDDDEDDDDSDMSFESLSFYNNDDLNSSLSSVSSLEFEPFEVIPLTQKKNIKVRVSLSSPPPPPIMKSVKFVPMSSSSRSNLLHVIDSSKKTTRKFQPFTTSSRRSLLIPIEEQTSPNKINCSICRCNGEVFDLQHKNDNNVCSSTLISLSGNVTHQSPLLLNCSLMSSCSSTFMTSISSSSSSNSLKNCSYC